MTLLTMSADSHVTEPGDCYLDRIDPRFRDRAPRAVTDDVMGAVLLIDEGKSRIPYGMVAAAGRPAEKIGPFEYVGWDELHAGGWDPVARLDEQARDGVASEVLYPSAGMLICNMDDADYKKACFDAYNLWIAEFQATSPSRLVGVGQTALRSVEEGVDDLHRIRDLGLRGVMMPGFPACLDEVGDYDDPVWDPFWEAAVGLRLPLSFHILTAGSTVGSGFRGPKMNSFLGILRANQDIVGTHGVRRCLRPPSRPADRVRRGRRRVGAALGLPRRPRRRAPQQLAVGLAWSGGRASTCSRTSRSPSRTTGRRSRWSTR